MAPKISIIVPVYNLEKYISRCLDSILAQTYTDFECICVNDGSTDNSASIISEYAKKDSRITQLFQSNKGLPSARHTGIRNSNGEFIIHLDGDDYLAPTALENLQNAQSQFDADIVFSDYYIDDENSQTCLHHCDYDFPRANSAELLQVLLEREQFFIWGKLIRRTLYHGVVLPSEIKYTEDMVHIIQIAAKCSVSTCVNKPLYYYVKRLGSMTSKLSSESHKQWYAATAFCVQFCSSLSCSSQLSRQLLKLQINQIDTYLQYISTTGYYRKDLRSIIFKLIRNWNTSGSYALRQLPGSSKIRLLLCLISQRVAVFFGKMYNKLIRHV